MVWSLEYARQSYEIIKRIHRCADEKLFESYETEKDRLVVRAINYVQNEMQLDGMVYKRYEDIALVLYVMLYNDERGFGSVKVPREYLEI